MTLWLSDVHLHVGFRQDKALCDRNMTGPLAEHGRDEGHDKENPADIWHHYAIKLADSCREEDNTFFELRFAGQRSTEEVRRGEIKLRLLI